MPYYGEPEQCPVHTVLRTVLILNGLRLILSFYDNYPPIQ